jgi:hypothetical protein
MIRPRPRLLPPVGDEAPLLLGTVPSWNKSWENKQTAHSTDIMVYHLAIITNPIFMQQSVCFVSSHNEATGIRSFFSFWIPFKFHESSRATATIYVLLPV